ncbi:MAG TPA: hypothetical protein PK141_29620, partial [Polyangiaceae bacterium]|nr:hypothetical protein [Polyangiaceae bacterium]
MTHAAVPATNREEEARHLLALYAGDPAKVMGTVETQLGILAARAQGNRAFEPLERHGAQQRIDGDRAADAGDLDIGKLGFA